MGATNPLSAKELQRIAGVSGKQYKHITWHTRTIVVKQFLPIQEYMAVAKKIIDDCRTPDGGVAVELIDFATRVNIISAYAFVEMPQNIEELFYLVYASDLYDAVCSVANREQIEAIKKSTSLAVEWGC